MPRARFGTTRHSCRESVVIGTQGSACFRRSYWGLWGKCEWIAAMKREVIETKLGELRRAKEQAIAQVNALAGAIALCEEFLKADVEQLSGQESRESSGVTAA